MEIHLQSPPESPKLDNHLPPLATTKKVLRRGRIISSRYKTAASPSSAPSSPIHHSSTSSSSLPQNFLTLPHSSRNSFQNPKHRRMPSAPSSPNATAFEFEISSHFADENQRSFETPVPRGVHSKAPTTQRRPVMRLFSDNTVVAPHTHIVEHHKRTMSSKISPGRPSIEASMARGHCPGSLKPVHCNQKQLRSMNKTATHEVKSKPLTPFHLSNGFMPDSSSEKPSTLVDSGSESCISSLGGLCHSPLIRGNGNSRTWQMSELRSSVPDAELLPTSSRRQAEGEELMIRRSLNSALSSCQANPPNPIKTVNSKALVQDMSSSGRIFWPPQPPSSRLGFDMKKVMKGSSRKEDAHALHLLHNQYLQWRFVNEKAKVAFKARTVTAERSLSEVSKNLNEIRDSVVEKRVELEKLKRLERLSNILDVEMPYLEDWALADLEFSTSLSGTIKALQDASIRLPIIGNLKVDIGELKEAIHSVTSMFESLSPSVGRFLPMQAGGVENVITELARVTDREKSLIEECGGLLPEVQLLQLKECSLRSMLMQAKRSREI